MAAYAYVARKESTHDQAYLASLADGYTIEADRKELSPYPPSCRLSRLCRLGH